ncbi:hypothetical protein J1N35_001493 [Gossypium stocksii]|uniref:Aminotransferase-like plant mobile domain-containing protein n=1 Tax=Gossypium stocksii TaxID=47602 RepID=A0A9D3WK09_9ROSI|nr:hypothetical protein J1N35_001493 [Gossypium stocksii]
MLYLQLAGFRDVALIHRFDLKANLLFVLVEQWCPKTHVFITSCGECTIILVDVTMQFGLRVDGVVVMDQSKMGHISENWCKPNINHLLLNDRGVHRKEN